MAMYAASILTTQEKRYNLSSSQLGALTSVGQVGTLLTIVPVAYFGGRSSTHRPRWIAVGIITMAVGILIGTLPHFVLGPYNYENNKGDNATTGISLCLSDSPTSNSGSECTTDGSDNSNDSTIAYAFFVAGVLVLGAGYSPLLTLGSAFVDDHAKHETSALYLGIINMMWGVGPVVGTLAGAGCLLLYVDFNRVDESAIDLEQSDQEWVGAWWLGMIVGVVIGILSAFPFFFIPKYLNSRDGGDNEKNEFDQKPAENSEKRIMSDESAEKPSLLNKLKGLIKSTWAILINPYFMIVLVAYAVDLGTTFGVVPFIPKYMQLQFGLSASAANVYTACFANLPYGIGMISGGIFIKKLKLEIKGMIKFLLTAVGLGIVVFAILANSIDKTQPCNEACSCSVDLFDPVCGSDGNTYASPCHAACTRLVGNDSYTDCGCLESPEIGADMKTASSGTCDEVETCVYFYLFLVGMFVFALLSSLREVPATMLAMRLVSKDQKTFALGVRFLFVRLFGPIPLPLIYGLVIDSSCSLWRTFCEGTVKGECLFYDNQAFRLNIVALTIGLKSFALVLYIIVLILWTRREKDLKDVREKIPEATNGLESSNKANLVTSHVESSELNGVTNKACSDDTYM
ncbi:solute carrier organic anion transporter family member 3A1-like [Glandiceps talaboti]